MKLKKLTAAFSAAAVSILGLAVIPAFAAEPAPGNVDTAKTGSITLHKYANPGIAPNTANADGTDAAKFASVTPIKGVEFTVTKLTPDLTNVDGWKEVKDLNAAVAADGTVDEGKKVTDSVVKQTTADDGSTKFGNLKVGAYLVEETDVTNATPKVKADGKAKPFIVTVPYNNGVKGWLYDVNVYPKNDIENGKASKTIVGEKYVKGDTVPWEFSLPVNALPAGKTRTDFGTWDALPTYLTFGGVVNAKFVPAVGNAVNINVNCEEKADKVWDKVTFEKKIYKCAVDKNDLTKLLAGGKVTFTLNSTLNGEVKGDKIEQAYQPFDSTNNGGSPTPNPDPEPGKPDKTQFVGGLEFSKVDKDTKGLTLGGAEFVLTEQKNGSCANVTAADKFKDFTATSEKTTGKVTFKDIPVAMEVSTTDASTLSAKYCLVESKAPAGYKQANPVEVTITAGTTATAGGLADGNFKNEKDTSLIPNLPLTGAAGSVILTLAGIALLAVAVGFGIRTARKNG